MVTVTVCVGSSCHIKGARDVIGCFDDLVKKHNLSKEVELRGSFCMERCGEGVNWKIGDEPVTSTTTESAVAVFRRRVLEPLGIRPDAAESASESGDAPRAEPGPERRAGL